MGDNAKALENSHDSLVAVTDPSTIPENQHESESNIFLIEDEGSQSEASDECEIVSVTSADEEEKWRDTTGPLTRLNALINAGYDNPRLLLTRLFHMDESILPTSESSLWGLVFSVLSDPAPRRRLRQFSSLESVVNLIRSSSQILVLTGAGISVSCGIPDFRSRDGVYARLAHDYPDLSSPQAMFDMDFFLRNPFPFFKFAKEIFPGQFKPSLAHRFISLLERKSKLLRNYTQNIDTLEQAAGISRIIQCHGSFATATCTTCSYRVRGEAIRDSIMAQTVPKCPKCCPPQANGVTSGPETKSKPIAFGEKLASHVIATKEHLTGTKPVSPVASASLTNKRSLRSRSTLRPTVTESTMQSYGVLKPDIVFFGEGLPPEFHDSLSEDIKKTDLVLVMGSSLKVRPVSHIPLSVPPKVPQVLINREALSSHVFDVELLGDCDGILAELCRRIGWTVLDFPTSDLSADLPDDTPGGKLVEVDLRVPLKAAVHLHSAIVARTTPGKQPANGDSEDQHVGLEVETHDSSAIISFSAGEVEDLSKLSNVNLAPATSVSASENELGLAKNVDKKLNSGSDVLQVLEASANLPEASNTAAASLSGIGTKTSPIDVDESDDVSVNSDFHLAEFLPANSFTRILPNQYIFSGAEMLFDYDMADDCLQHDGSLFGENSDSCCSSCESQGSPDTNELPRPESTDPVVRRLLSRCRADVELQHYLLSKKNMTSTCRKKSKTPAAHYSEVVELLSDTEQDDNQLHPLITSSPPPPFPITRDFTDDCVIIGAPFVPPVTTEPCGSGNGACSTSLNVIHDDEDAKNCLPVCPEICTDAKRRRFDDSDVAATPLATENASPPITTPTPIDAM